MAKQRKTHTVYVFDNLTPRLKELRVEKWAALAILETAGAKDPQDWSHDRMAADLCSLVSARFPKMRQDRFEKMMELLEGQMADLAHDIGELHLAAAKGDVIRVVVNGFFKHKEDEKKDKEISDLITEYCCRFVNEVAEKVCLEENKQNKIDIDNYGTELTLDRIMRALNFGVAHAFYEKFDPEYKKKIEEENPE